MVLDYGFGLVAYRNYDLRYKILKTPSLLLWYSLTVESWSVGRNARNHRCQEGSIGTRCIGLEGESSVFSSWLKTEITSMLSIKVLRE